MKTLSPEKEQIQFLRKSAMTDNEVRLKRGIIHRGYGTVSIWLQTRIYNFSA